MKISVIVPVLNEEASVGALINFVRQHGGETVNEIIVVDGGSTDSTVQVVQKAGAQIIFSAVKSRAAQMNLGAKAASGNILFLCMPIQSSPILFVSDIQLALNEGYDAGCYRYAFDSEKFMLKINAWFTRFDFLPFRGGDQTLFIRREVFEWLNGFDEYFSIMEDYDMLIRLRKKFRFKIIQKDIRVSARKYDTNSWLRVQVANLVAFTMFRWGKTPDKIKATYKRMLDYR